MIEIQRIREQQDEVLNGLSKRNIDATKEVEQILILDKEWRGQKTALQNLEAELNTISKQIGQLFSAGKKAEAQKMKAKTLELKTAIQSVKKIEEGLENEIKSLLYTCLLYTSPSPRD